MIDLNIEKEAISLIKDAISTTFTKNHKNKIGIPQGLSISNILAEIYMLDIDNEFGNYDIFYKRYVDDVLIFCHKSDSKNIYSKFRNKIEELKLETHEENSLSDKTIIKNINENFSYLGYVYNPYNNNTGVNISIRDSSKKRFQDSIAALFTSYMNSGKKRSKALLLWKLNLRITGCIANKKCKGWLFFFSEIDDMKMLFELDYMIRKLCNRHHVEYKNIKKLTRAIHEIKHNKWNNNYFPNFDSYNYEKMKDIVAYDKGIPPHKLKLSDQDIANAFWSIINREVKSMETDISSFS